VIHLDTNVAIALLNGRPAGVRERFDAVRASGQRVAMSAIAFHELRYGAAASERPIENERKLALFIASAALEIEPFGERDAIAAGGLRALLRRAGTPIGPFDALIAAQALRAGATLVTANGREFQRVPGLALADWAAAP
jgi:tRNA(fMet)-specific endonuclease VapC